MVVVTARVHAGETMGSFKAEGIVDFLVSSQPMAMQLRNLYVFKVVPMLNPEGVVAGNFRCSVTGVDLNRRWDNPDEILHPQIFYLKNLLRKYKSESREILVFCDLHGHSRKLNSFIYGCNKAANGGFCSWTKVRLLPRILATKTPMFSYNDSSFRVQSSKHRTARVVVWKELEVTNSFTLESSFFGYTRSDEVAAFGCKEFYEIGRMFLRSLVEYYYVLKGLEKELVLTKGWLKPSRLLALTGVLAADELAKKIAIEKKEARAKRRVMESAKREKDKLRKYSVSKEKSKKLSTDYNAVAKSINEAYKKNTRENSMDALETGNMKSLGKYTASQLKLHNTRATFSENPRDNSLSTAGRNKERLKSREMSLNEGLEDGKKNWRKYFPKKELEIAYKQIASGLDPNDIVSEQKSEDESDSNPSEDNLGPEEMQDLLSSIPTVSSCLAVGEQGENTAAGSGKEK